VLLLRKITMSLISLTDYEKYWTHAVNDYWVEVQTACSPYSAIIPDYGHYLDLASGYGIHDKLAISPLWYIDSLLCSYNKYSNIDDLMTVELPVCLFTYISQANINIFSCIFKDEVLAKEVTDSDCSGYDAFYNLKTKALVYYPRQECSDTYFNIDTFIDSVEIFTSFNLHHHPGNVRICLYALSKRIKSNYKTFYISSRVANEAFRYCDNYDKDVNSVISPMMQKALLVKFIISNPYIRCNLVIV